MKVLITGATGFLGKELVSRLLKSDFKITVTGRDINKLESVFQEAIIIKQETDYSYDSLLAITKNQDVVIHLASQLMQRDTDPLRISGFSNNIQCVEDLLISCTHNKVKKFINTSSISVYDLSENLDEERSLCPSNIYGVSKANIETYMNYMQTKTDVDIISLRLARLYGVGEREGLMFTDFIKKAQNKQVLTLHGKGASTIEYIYIKDVLDVIDLFIQGKNIRGSFNVGTGRAISVKEIAENVNAIFDNQHNITYLQDKPDGMKGSVMNVEKIKNQMRWKAQWNLEKSIIDIKNILNNSSDE